MSSLRRMWHHLPFVIQTILIGLTVAAAGEIPWSLLVSANITWSPSFPWATMLMAIWLIAYVWYLSGRGWPQTSQNWRRARFRQTELPARVWLWSLVAGGLAIMSLIAVQFVLLRLVQLPGKPQPFLPAISAYSLLLLSVMSACASAIPEEVGFRGYIQSALEQKYTPASAILLTSFAFMLAHLNHGVSTALIFDFAFGAVFGVLAFRSSSILPGMVLHSGFDLIQFVAGRRLASVARALPLIWDSGMDRWFLAECSACGLLALGAFFAFRKLPGGETSALQAAPGG